MRFDAGRLARFLKRFAPGIPLGFLLGALALAGGSIAREVARQAGVEAAEPDLVAVDRFVEAKARRSRIPAVALAIAEREGTVHVAAFDGGDITPNSPFLIGSVTKTFTALAVAQLVDAGTVDFDDPVQRHLPDFALKDLEASREITLRNLLTHTSGLSQWSGHDRRAQQEARFDHIAPVRPPGTEFEYSSLNYIILGQVVEAVSGLEYAEYVERHIFAPLRMNDSFADPRESAAHELVRGHWYLFGLTIPRAAESAPAPLVPAGFLASSATDLANYLSMWLGEGEFEGQQLVSQEILQEMLTPWDGGEVGAGMAWGIGTTRIAHSGNTRGFSARLAMLPAEGYGIAVLANVNSGPFFEATGEILDGVARILRGEDVEPGWPEEILFKLALLLVVSAGVARMLWRLRAWAARGYPMRLGKRGRVLRPLVIEVALVLVVLFVVPRWIGVPLSVLVEYFPDLGIAIWVGVVTGLASAMLKAFLLRAEGHTATAG